MGQEFTECLTDLSQVLPLSNTNDSSPRGKVSISCKESTKKMCKFL